MVHTLALSPHALARSRRSAEDCLRYVYITQERVHKSQDMLARSDRLIAQLHDLGYQPSGMSGNRNHHGAACTCSSAVTHSLHLSDFTEPPQSPRPLLRGSGSLNRLHRNVCCTDRGPSSGTQLAGRDRARQCCFQYVVFVSNSSKLSGLALASNHFVRASPSIVPWALNSRARDSISG